MLSIALIATAGLQLGLPNDADVPEQTQLPPRREHLSAKPLPADYPEILRRPVFAPDRQPMMEAMDGFVLLGMGTAGDKATILLQSGGKVMRAHPGDTVMGWKITEAAQNRLSFARGYERRILVLDPKARRAAPSSNTRTGAK